MKKYLFLFVLIFALAGCTVSPGSAGNGNQPRAEAGETVPAPAVEAEAAALAEAVPPSTGIVLEPEAPGTREVRCDTSVVDHSHAEEGYIMASYFAETDKRLKVLLKGPTTTYQYDLPQGEWAVLPLSDGDGCYQAAVCRNVTGSEYAVVMVAELDVTLDDESAPFLRPNPYVNYVAASNTVARGAELCADLSHPLEKVAAVHEYVVQNIRYDEEKAATVQSGYLPDLDEILEIKKGICFDYAAMMTAMLRSQEVPCKLVVGYAGQPEQMKRLIQ